MSNTVTTRAELQKAIQDISAIKRFFICMFIRRKQWKLARAYSIVTVDLLYKDHPSTDEMWKKSDALCAKLSDINYRS